MKKTSLYEKAFLESLNVRKNSKGLMGSKTKVHKDKKKDASKKMGRKKVKEEDENTVGGGVLGPAAATGTNPLQNTDFYASGDYRKPKALGAIQTRRGSISKRRKKKKQK